MMGVWPLNESVAIGRSRDKLRSMQLLARAGIGLPVTAFAHDPEQTAEVLKLVGGAPVVIKLIEGTQGIGVVLGETESSAKSVIEAFRGANVNILVQEFIAEARGTDIRVFVIGGKVAAAMQRTGSGDDFRSNLHRGGSAETVKISPQERRDRATRREDTGSQRLRRRHAPLKSRSGGDGGQLLAWPGGHRADDRLRRRRRHHRLHGAAREAQSHADSGQGLTAMRPLHSRASAPADGRTELR